VEVVHNTPGKNGEPNMINIQDYQPQFARDAFRLIYQTYSEFNHTEGTCEAVGQYLASYDPDQALPDIERRFSLTPLCFLALDGEVVVGVIRGNKNRIINLFVAGQYHRKGIATNFIRKFESECIMSHQKEIVLRASLFAVPFYQSLGYKKTTGVRNLHGLVVQPMKKKLVHLPG
jgi:GNAT superfamily N-acetyltransferase